MAYPPERIPELMVNYHRGMFARARRQWVSKDSRWAAKYWMVESYAHPFPPHTREQIAALHPVEEGIPLILQGDDDLQFVYNTVVFVYDTNGRLIEETNTREGLAEKFAYTPEGYISKRIEIYGDQGLKIEFFYGEEDQNRLTGYTVQNLTVTPTGELIFEGEPFEVRL